MRGLYKLAAMVLGGFCYQRNDKRQTMTVLSYFNGAVGYLKDRITVIYVSQNGKAVTNCVWCLLPSAH